MNAKPDLRAIGEKLEETAQRQRDAFADFYTEVSGDAGGNTEEIGHE